MNMLLVEQLFSLHETLSSQEIVCCNDFTCFSKEEIKAEACSIAQRDNLSIITIGWSTDNPRICLNKNGKSD